MYYKNCFSGYIIRENQLKKVKTYQKLILRQGFTQTLTSALHHKKKPLYPAVQGNLSYISQKQELSYPFSSIMRLSSRHPVWILLTTVEQLIPVRQAISRYDIRSQYRILISSCTGTGRHESCSARQNSASSYPSGMPSSATGSHSYPHRQPPADAFSGNDCTGNWTPANTATPRNTRAGMPAAVSSATDAPLFPDTSPSPFLRRG